MDPNSYSPPMGLQPTNPSPSPSPHPNLLLDLQAKLREVVNENDDLKRRLAQFKEENEELKEDKRSFRMYNEHLKGEVDHMREELERERDENAKLRSSRAEEERGTQESGAVLQAVEEPPSQTQRDRSASPLTPLKDNGPTNAETQDANASPVRPPLPHRGHDGDVGTPSVGETGSLSVEDTGIAEPRLQVNPVMTPGVETMDVDSEGVPAQTQPVFTEMTVPRISPGQNGDTRMVPASLGQVAGQATQSSFPADGSPGGEQGPSVVRVGVAVAV